MAFLLGERMNYIIINKDNIDTEHICCAMSNKKSLKKKEWLKERFDEGLVFYRSEERGKCFIEYIPDEYAWIPLNSHDYMYINCLSKKWQKNLHLNIEYRWGMNAVNASDREIWSKK